MVITKPIYKASSKLLEDVARRTENTHTKSEPAYSQIEIPQRLKRQSQRKLFLLIHTLVKEAEQTCGK